MLAAISQELIERLEPLQDLGFQIVPFSGDSSDLQRPPVDRLIVGFQREVLEPPQLLNKDAQITQPRTLEFRILIQLKDLRNQIESNPQTLNAMDAIRDRMTGFHPKSAIGGQWFYETSGGFSEVMRGFWFYAMSFTLPCPYIKRSEH